MARLTDNLLRRAVIAAGRHAAMQAELSKAFEERYGKTYSDVDADYIIDALDCGQGSITLVECDEHMARLGAPVIKRKTPR